MNRVEHLIDALDREAPLLRAHQGPGRQQEWADIMEAASDALAAGQDGRLDEWTSDNVTWDPQRRPGETDVAYYARINDVEPRRSDESDVDYEARVQQARQGDTRTPRQEDLTRDAVRAGTSQPPGYNMRDPLYAGDAGPRPPRLPGESDADYNNRVGQSSPQPRRQGESDADYNDRVSRPDQNRAGRNRPADRVTRTTDLNPPRY